MLISMDHKLDELLAFSFSQTPSKRLESRTHPNFFVRLNQKLFDLAVVKRGQLLLHLHELLCRVDRVERRQRNLLHVLEAFRAETVNALDSRRWQHTLHWVESVLKLPMDWFNLLFE